MSQENDLEEIAKVFLFAIIVTFIPFYIFEIYIPYIEKMKFYEQKCESAGGFVYEKQNEVKRCIKKDYIIINI